MQTHFTHSYLGIYRTNTDLKLHGKYRAINVLIRHRIGGDISVNILTYKDFCLNINQKYNHISSTDIINPL